MDVKQCTKCMESKSLFCFGLDRKNSDGLNCVCRECRTKSNYRNQRKLDALLKKRGLTGAERWGE